MQLLPSRPRSFEDSPRTFRTSPWGPGLAAGMVLVFGGLFGGLALPTLRAFPWFGWILAAPVILVAGGATLLMLGLFLHMLRESVRDTNWILSVARDGLHVNLRSFLNAGGECHDASIAAIPFGEIRCAR